MFDKINPKNIILDHISTLKDNKTQKTSFGDVFTFFILPLIIGGFLLFVLKIEITDYVINILITSLSIFAALLFNLLLLVYEIVNGKSNKTKIKSKILKEIYSNISFSIFSSILAVILLLLYSIVFTYVSEKQIFILTINFLIYYLTITFLLTLFMILKRIHILLSKEFDKKKRGN